MLVKIGLISIAFFLIASLFLDFYLGSLLPGYDWKSQSISYIGNSLSPLLFWVKCWGVLFSICLTLFARAFYYYFKGNFWALTGTLCLLLYGFGEGIGSAFFPINPEGFPENSSSFLHNLFSGIGDIGLVGFPFLLLLIYPSSNFPFIRKIIWSVILIGFTFGAFFLVAKYIHPDNWVVEYKGLWQRLFILNYHFMFGVLGIYMWRFPPSPDTNKS